MTAATLGAYIVFEDEAGFSMTPPRARTWGRRGHTPVVRVRGRSWRRWSIAAMCCYKPGENSRLIYRPRRHANTKARDATPSPGATIATWSSGLTSNSRHLSC